MHGLVRRTHIASDRALESRRAGGDTAFRRIARIVSVLPALVIFLVGLETRIVAVVVVLKSVAPGVASMTTNLRDATGFRLTTPNLNSTNYKGHVVDTTAFAVALTTNPYVVEFNMPVGIAADAVAVRSHHTGAEFVKYLECGLVSFKASWRWNWIADMPGV